MGAAEIASLGRRPALAWVGLAAGAVMTVLPLGLYAYRLWPIIEAFMYMDLEGIDQDPDRGLRDFLLDLVAGLSMMGGMLLIAVSVVVLFRLRKLAKTSTPAS